MISSAPIRWTRPMTSTLRATALAVLLACLMITPAAAAGSSGTVSVSIRVEVDLADLHRGGILSSLDGTARSNLLLAGVAPVLRRSLAGRYHRDELERIVSETASQAVLVYDDRAISSRRSTAAFVHNPDGAVFSL